MMIQNTLFCDHNFLFFYFVSVHKNLFYDSCLILFQTVFLPGDFPSISTSIERLRKLRVSTITDNTKTHAMVGSVATVAIISPATNTSKPNKIAFPNSCLNNL